MRTLSSLAASLVLLCSCGVEPASNSTGQLAVTGDQAWGGALKGTGLSKVAQATGYTCQTWLYDRLSQWGDDHPGDREAAYVFGLQLGRSTTGLTTRPVGAQAQGDASKGTSTPWPSEVRATFDRYDGFKHSATGVYTTGGTVTITRFDAEKLVGTFSLTGLDQYCVDGAPCTLQATGSFDVANVECGP